MNTATFLRSLMSQAWYMVKHFGYKMADAMRQAWKIAKCRAMMRKEIVHFRFTKADGSTREAWGTLQPTLLPSTSGTGRKPYPHLVTYFDTIKNEYRCFNIANFIGMA